MSRFVDQLIEHEREIHFAAAQYRVRQTEKVLAAQHQARVAQTMKDLDFSRADAERVIEIEDILSGVDWARRQQDRV